jgi:glycosyltransferase involved in cell wall biosynthesis
MKRLLLDAIFAYRVYRAGGRPALSRWWQEHHQNHVHVISRSPPVVLSVWGKQDSILYSMLANRHLTMLYAFFWSLDQPQVLKIAQDVKLRLHEYPHHRIILLCNEEWSVTEFKNAGVDAIFCNHNAFANETVFRPIAEIRKDFDAIYVAALAPYKRLELAATIPALFLISYRWGGTYSDDYEIAIRKKLSHAFWANDQLNQGRKFAPEELAPLLNRCHVGLCLSEAEGAMFASIEYLLCGIPIVSTPSRGGRDAFWDERFVIVCEPTAEAVAAAVQELKRRSINPMVIRSATLERMRQHRKILRDTLAPAVREIECPWPPGSHGALTYRDLRKLGKALQSNNGEALP